MEVHRFLVADVGLGLLERAYAATFREDDEKILISALGSMVLRLEVREACLQVDPSVFYHTMYGRIWEAARELAGKEKLMLPANFAPLLNTAEMRTLESLHGRPVRKIEFQTAIELVKDAARRRGLIDGMKSVALVAADQDYPKAVGSVYELVEVLDHADTSTVSVSLADALTEFWEDVENPGEKKRRFQTPWPSLDEECLNGGHSPGELVVWMAPSGGGKSVALLQTAAKWASDGLSLAIFSLEMDYADVLNRMLSTSSGQKIRSIASRDVSDSNTREHLEDATDRLRDSKVQIFDAADMTVEDIRSHCASMKRSQGLDAIFVDYIQIIEPSDMSVPREQQVSRIVKQLKQLAMSFDCVVMTATQMNESSDRPSNSSVRESRAIVHHSDVVLGLHHTTPGDVDVVVTKNRRGKIMEGIAMAWNPQSSSIVDYVSR